MIQRRIADFVLHFLFDLGLIIFLSPLILGWWIHGDYDRYLWIISGPWPYSSMGSGPFQMAMAMGLFLVGLAIMVVALILGRAFKKKSHTEITEIIS